MPTTPPDFQGPRIRSSLVALKCAVKDYFEQVGIRAGVYLGLRARDLWDTSRVVLIDGEFDGANVPKPMSAGEFLPPGHKQSYNPRELILWERPITASIRAVDEARIDDEDAQTEATEGLIEATVQAIHNATIINPTTQLPVPLGQAGLEWGKATWVNPGTSTQQTHGKEFLVTFIHKTVLFDAAELYVKPTPQLQKGPLLNNTRGGINAVMTSVAGTSAVISGLGLCHPSYVGMSLTLSGAANGGNNGTFPIIFFNSPRSLVITNAGAVAPDANNGSITWQVGPPT
jgi:hypothetical protein